MSALRRTATLTALVLGAALLTPTGSATAAGETCRGEAATIVSTDYKVTGTEGRDVIVALDTAYLDALGGDDLICLGTGSSTSIANVTVLDAGAGNDVVDASATNRQVDAVLGVGADEFVGSPQADSVAAGESDSDLITEGVDSEPDVIDTGAGNDSIRSGVTGSANADVVTGGAGDDYVQFAGQPAATSRVDGNDGRDTLSITTGPGSTRIDAGTGTATHDGAALAFAGFEAYAAYVTGEAQLSFLGTAAPEWVSLTGRNDTVVTADLGAGDDEFGATWDAAATGSRIDGGAGNDDLTLSGRSVRADLRRSTLEVDGRTSRIPGFENVSALGRSVTLIGDEQDNVLYGGLCRVRLVGGAGNDRLAPSFAESSGDTCERRSISADGGPGRDTIDGTKGDDVLRGGRGADEVRGHTGDDRLLGGPGRDLVRGDGGLDACAAEVERSCER